MALIYNNGFAQLHHGSASDMFFIPDTSVDCVVTSPPYWGLRDYGLEPTVWDGAEGCEHEWGAGLTLSHSNRNGATESLGGNIRGGGEWKSPSAGSFCIRCPAWLGNLGLEPTPQLFAQHLVQVFREVWRVLKPTGTVWLNLGDSYAGGGGAHKQEHANPGLSKSSERNGVPTSEREVMSGLKPKDLVGIPWRVAFALQADGWYLRSDIIWSKPNPMPESVTDRPTKAHEYMFLLTKSPRYYYDADAIREDGPSYTRKAGGYEEHYKQGASRFGGKGGFGDSDVTTYGRNKRTVWEIATQPYPEAHFSTYPEKLVEPCILAGCPQDGVVLDPFAGSGTTLAVAQKLGRKSIGVDQSLEYINLAVERIGAISLPMLGL